LPYSELVRQLTEASGESSYSLPAISATLIPEVFYDPSRAAFHVERVRAKRLPLTMLAYDFLPFLRPELFNLPSSVPLMGYLTVIREASSVAHISAQTAQDYAQRVMRGCGPSSGPVLPLGADGLEIEKQQWRTDRKAFVALGSIDGRKNQHLIVAAFVRLWQAGHRMPLVLIGRAFNEIDKTFLREATAFPQFRWLENASDADIAEELRHARATIYVSTAEGFGLPPVESLAVGIPVIASSKLPSLLSIPSQGQLRLSNISSETIAHAVMRLQNDAAVTALWAEASSLNLNTWDDFGFNAAKWLTDFLLANSV
jgi:glycosyltransferase involved in cell wall biosynthesis